MGGIRGHRYRLYMRPSVLELLVRYVLRWLWAWRREIATVAALWWWSRLLVTDPATGWTVAGLVGVALTAPWVGPRARCWLRGGALRRRWGRACAAAGLVNASGDGPRIRWVRPVPGGLVLRLRLAPGMSRADVERQLPRMTASMGAHQARVRHDGPRADRLRILLIRRETLGRIVRPAPLSGPPHELDSVVVGSREDGRPWRLRVRGRHILVAGATGAGKGSVLWSLIRALAPAVHAGLVQIIACDPKGGMELAFGRPLYRAFGTNAEQIAVLLEDAVERLRERTGRLAGRTRLHVPTVAEPLVVVIVDEIAALTAYVQDTALRKRITSALAELLTQGRAPGFVVVGAVQDPRRDVLAVRDLFPEKVCLRVATASEVDMVLGAGAREAGALADQIPIDTPGVAFARSEDDPEPGRVRAAYVDDPTIHATADRYPDAGRPVALPGAPERRPLPPGAGGAMGGGAPWSGPGSVDVGETTIPMRRPGFAGWEAGPAGGWTPVVPGGLRLPRPDPLGAERGQDQGGGRQGEGPAAGGGGEDWGGVAPGPIDWEAVAEDYRRRHHLDQDGQPVQLGPHAETDGDGDGDGGQGGDWREWRGGGRGRRG